MPFCGQCGAKLTEDMRFCPQCGRKAITPRPSQYTDWRVVHPKEAAPEEPAAAASTRRSAPAKNSSLYRQWIKHAGLATLEKPEEKSAQVYAAPEERAHPDYRALFILLGAVILVLCAGLIVMILKFL